MKYRLMTLKGPHGVFWLVSTPSGIKTAALQQGMGTKGACPGMYPASICDKMHKEINDRGSNGA